MDSRLFFLAAPDGFSLPASAVTYAAVPGNDGQPGKSDNAYVCKAELCDLRRETGLTKDFHP